MMNEQSESAEMKIEPSSAELKIQKRRGLIYQMTMSLFANVSVLGPAMSMGYSAVILPTLRSETSDLPITDSQASWIAGAAAFGTPLGCILSSLLMRRGRRVTLLASSTISLIGWLLIYMSTNYEQLVVGRVISGIATGLASMPATVYTAEIAYPAWRGTMVTWTSIGIALGILLVYIFGYFIQENWRLIALICGLFPATALLLTILTIPESPLYLRDRGRIDEARVIMKKFRGIRKDATAPATIEYELHHPHLHRETMNKNLFHHLKKRSAIMPFVIMLGYFFFQQFSGVFVVVFYAVDITAEAGVTIDAYIGAILIGLTRLIGSIFVAVASKRWGRRVPSVVSGAGMSLCMGILSIYLFIIDRGYRIDDKGAIPALCILFYIFMSTIGFLVLPFAMVSEIFPAKVKDLLTGLTVCIGYLFSFVTIKIYQDLLDVMGKHGVFMFYAIVSLIGTIFIFICLPETKGKTLHEIEELFAKKRRDNGEKAMENEKMFCLKDVSAAA